MISRQQPSGPTYHRIVSLHDANARESVARLVERLGGRVGRFLPLVNALCADFDDPNGHHALLNHPQVAFVTDDVELKISLPHLGRGPRREHEPQAVPWNIWRIGAPDAWSVTRGKGVVIGVIDTGIALDHPDLNGNLAAGYNALRPGRSAHDDNGHGSMVAGVIAALDNEIGVVGVGPRLAVAPVKALDANGSGRLSAIVDALQWCLENRIPIVNLSIGLPGRSVVLHQAVERAYERGLFLVAAVGNGGPRADSVEHPARLPFVVGVGASTPENRVAAFSARGEGIDLTAPGVEIRSTHPGGYRVISGTSIAAPHVSAVAGLILAANGPLPPAEIRHRLLKSGRRLAGESLSAQGRGLVDARLAL
ncbi:MAG TPA: S8 family peptidase [Limnochordia bacterium]|nr:S8 family peptidase [Limnochordia bacterium]